MLRIAMIGIAGVLLALQVKALKPEYGMPAARLRSRS